MTRSQSIEVNLLGQKIALKSTESDPEVIQAIFQLVSKKLGEAESRARGAAAHQVALLALLDLAEEYVKARKRTLDFKQQLDDKSSKLLDLVEAGFK